MMAARSIAKDLLDLLITSFMAAMAMLRCQHCAAFFTAASTDFSASTWYEINTTRVLPRNNATALE